MSTLTPHRRPLLIAAALLIATLAVYWPVAGHQYLSVDDHAYVSSNDIVKAGLTWNGVVWAFSGAHVSNYHPVTWLSHMLDCELFGPGPRPAHLVNLALHALNAVLLFLILRWMTGRDWCSAFVAAVFALHPQHVESVAWVSERKDVLSGLFWILALAAWTAYVERPHWSKYALALLAFALGLLSKPMVVTLPCVLLLLDFWPLRRVSLLGSDPARPHHRSIPFLLIEKIPFFLLAVGGSAATVLAQSGGGAVVAMEDVPLGFRAGNAIVAYLLYARKFLWPSDLAAFYPLLRPWPLLTVLATLTVLLVVTALVLVKGRSKPYLPVGWFWFLGTLVPVIGLVQVGNQSMADRYMYLPMIGLAILVAWYAADLLAAPGLLRRRAPGIALGGATLALFGLAIVASVDVRAWRDSETLFARAIERTEPNVFAYHNLASAKVLRGDTAAAIELYEKCTDLQPGNPHVRRAYGFALRQAKRTDEAFKQIKLAIEISPGDGRSWAEMARVQMERQRWPLAVRDFRKAVRLQPHDIESRAGLAHACRMAGDLEASLAALRSAIEIDPRLPRLWCGAGALLVELGRPAEAVEPLRRAVALDRNLTEAHYRLGVALMRSGQGERALQPLMSALALEPQSAPVLKELAWVLATHPNEKLRRGGDALQLAGTASALASGSAEVLDTLAAAQAEQQQFDRAVASATRAAALAREAGDAALAETIERRIDRYRAHQPIRDETLVGADLGEAIP